MSGSVLDQPLWEGEGPTRAFDGPAGYGRVPCPLREGGASIVDCSACGWASEVSSSGGTAIVRCNLPLGEVLRHARDF